MKLIQLTSIVLAIGLMAGCKTIDIQDGRIPDKYLPQAKKLEGIYKGDFNGVPGDLIVSFQGNKVVVTYRNSRGEDLLNNNCRSSFGNLLKVTVKNENKKPQVSSALFDFDAGDCSLMVRGRSVSFDFTQTNQGMRLQLMLLKELRESRVCTWNPGVRPGTPPSQTCTWQQEPIYLFGRFIR